MASCQHQPATRQQCRGAHLRGAVCRASRRQNPRIHDISSALRRRGGPVGESRLRRHNHCRTPRTYRAARTHRGLRHIYNARRMRLAHRQRSHKHNIARAQPRGRQPRLLRRRQDGCLYGTRHGPDSRRGRLYHRPRAQLHQDDVRHPHLRFCQNPAHGASRSTHRDGRRPYLPLRALRLLFRRLSS